MSTKPHTQVKGRIVAKDGHTEVEKLPRRPDWGVSYWLNSPNGRNEYTHQLFRFPAKFHPPVVRWALGTFGRRGSIVLDPFTGSGTVQVEALLRGINSVGIDIDPLACLIAQVKSTPIDPKELQKSLVRIEIILTPFLQAHAEQENVAGADMTVEQFERESTDVTIPPLPNIFHWFRRYVIIDLARILGAIEQAELEEPVSRFFRACAAAIIRRVSNADPDPVSGLEVTKVQIERNKKRTIKVFNEFFSKVRREILQMGMMWEALHTVNQASNAIAHVVRGDILSIEHLLMNLSVAQDGFPLVVTSPPYCRSVNYSRRHRLEMFWLGLVENADEHVELAHLYIGRRYVRVNDWTEQSDFGIKDLDDTLRQIADRDPHKSRTVHHYFSFMSKSFRFLRFVMTKRGTMVCVIGDSVCCGVSIATADFIAKIATEHFELRNRFSYAVRNHHMQYGLWNGDGIKKEHVLVMKPR